MKNVPWTTAGAWIAQFMRHQQEVAQIPGVSSSHVVTASQYDDESLLQCFISVQAESSADLEQVALQAAEVTGLPVGVLVALRDRETDGPGPKAFPGNAALIKFSPEFDPSAQVLLSTGRLEVRSSNILDTLPHLLVGLADAVEEGLPTRHLDGQIQRIAFDPIEIEILTASNGYSITLNRMDGSCLGAVNSSDFQLRGRPGTELVDELLSARSLNQRDQELQT